VPVTVTLWFAALMGLVQGLTEFIPVSSTAHLRILPALFGQPEPGAPYTAVIQLGTLLAVLAYFAKDLVHLPVAMIKDPSSTDGCCSRSTSRAICGASTSWRSRWSRSAS
jgi:undecaprenyl pyrophosphate phosphatase UppP